MTAVPRTMATIVIDNSGNNEVRWRNGVDKIGQFAFAKTPIIRTLLSAISFTSKAPGRRNCLSTADDTSSSGEMIWSIGI